MGEWKRGRWYRVTLPGGKLWMETSDPQEARFGLFAPNGNRQGHPPGARIEELWQKTESEWRDLPPL